jgi:prepilin-type N-terminal cleavage/methylation domain-containing protein
MEMKKLQTKSPFKKAFSLIEMLVVVGIIGMLMVLSVPALRTLAVGSGLDGAANTLLAHLDQARLAAIESGSVAYLGFPPNNFAANSDPSLAASSFIVFRKRGPNDDINLPDFIPLSRWVRLPKGTVLNLAQAQLSNEVENSAATLIPQLNYTDVRVQVIAYDRFGSIKSGAPGMKISLGNGLVTPDGTVSMLDKKNVLTYVAQRVVGSWIPEELVSSD